MNKRRRKGTIPGKPAKQTDTLNAVNTVPLSESGVKRGESN